MRVHELGKVVLLLLLGLVLITGCDEDSNVTGVRNHNFSAEEPFSFVVDRAERTRLDLIGINGNITITGTVGTSTITISGEKRVESDSMADATENLARLDVVVGELPEHVQVRTIQPQHSDGRNYIVDYTIGLPEDLQVQVSNVNGGINVRQMVNRVTIQNINGAILATDIEGSTLAAVVNGQIEARVSLPPDGSIDLSATNGNIALEIPPDTSADFSARVVNGHINTNNLDLANEVRTASRVSGTLGTGNGSINLQTVNGAIVAMVETF